MSCWHKKLHWRPTSLAHWLWRKNFLPLEAVRRRRPDVPCSENPPKARVQKPSNYAVWALQKTVFRIQEHFSRPSREQAAAGAGQIVGEQTYEQTCNRSHDQDGTGQEG